MQGVELLDDRAGRAAALVPAVDHADNLGGLRVDDELVLVLGAFGVAVGRVVAEKLAALPLHGKGAFDLHGELSDVVVVHNVGKRHKGAAIGLRVAQAVDVVEYRDHADALLREVVLHELAELRVVSAQARIVLKDHAVDLARLDVRDHAPVRGALEVAAGIAVVGVDLDGGNDLALLLQMSDMVFYDFALVLDAVAFRFIPVLFAQT